MSILEYCEPRYFRAVHIFALFTFIKYPRKYYIVKITVIMQHSGKNIKNANINLREIANFRKYAKVYTRENIYVHSSLMSPVAFKKSPCGRVKLRGGGPSEAGPQWPLDYRKSMLAILGGNSYLSWFYDRGAIKGPPQTGTSKGLP